MGRRFEELDVRGMSQELIRGLGRIFYADTFRNRGFQDQIMRSAISIANNVAEGNERGSDRDFVKFLYYAKGSAGEVRSMLYSAQDFKYITNEQFILFADQCIRISTKINNFITSLKK